MKMNVFQFDGELKVTLLNLLANGIQSVHNLAAFVVGQQTTLCQHLSVCRRCFHVLRVESPVKANAFAELLDAAVGGLAKDPGPGFGGHTVPFAERPVPNY
jgi:hypothetical protein